MRLDVLIPTHNRAALLGRALDSLLAADRPDGLEVDITVIDNRSTDYTPEVVESFTLRSVGHVHYLYESQPGRSHALNAGIAATTGDLVGMIDDDEEVDCGWLRTIAAAFEDVTTDFIGGPYLPRWGGKRPAWLGAGYLAAIGWAESGQATQQFGPGFSGMLMGGNAVIRRTVLERAGPYWVDLGRTPGTRLMSCEDEDMFTRLLAIRARGFYRPDLVIHHYVPPERLTRGYFRRWCFWHGVSQAVLHKRRPAMVPYVLGIPRYMIGVAVRGTIKRVRSVFGPRDPARAFKNELDWWEVGGFFYGKHVHRISAVRQQAGSRVEAEEAALDETRGSMRGSVAKSEGRRSSRLTANETPQPGPVKTPFVAPDRQA